MQIAGVNPPRFSEMPTVMELQSVRQEARLASEERLARHQRRLARLHYELSYSRDTAELSSPVSAARKLKTAEL